MERKLIISGSPEAIQAVWSELTALFDDMKVEYCTVGEPVITSYHVSRDALRDKGVTIEVK